MWAGIFSCLSVATQGISLNLLLGSFSTENPVAFVESTLLILSDLGVHGSALVSERYQV
jgi:hypothetical protein